MKLKNYLSFFAILFGVSLFLIANNAITRQITKSLNNGKVKTIEKTFDKRLVQKHINGKKYWMYLPEKISTKYPTPVVFLLHGGVFQNIDYGYVFLRSIFIPFIKNYNIIFVLPTMPKNSWPVWQKKDEKFVLNVIEKVTKNYILHHNSKVFLGGFSNGAEVALKMVLSNQVRVDGTFAFAGGCRLVQNKINPDVNRDLPVFLSSGYGDGNWVGSSVHTYNVLKQKGFTNLSIKGYPMLEHWISDKQISRLLTWINKIVNNNTSSL